MGAYNKHEFIEEKMCREVDLIENKYKDNGKELDIEDVKKLDILYHTLKSKATYDAMKEAEEYEREEEGFSGRRGRSPATGRYVSRDMAPQQSYAQGYSEGYSEAMGQMSGHHPMGIYPDRYRY